MFYGVLRRLYNESSKTDKHTGWGVEKRRRARRPRRPFLFDGSTFLAAPLRCGPSATSFECHVHLLNGGPHRAVPAPGRHPLRCLKARHDLASASPVMASARVHAPPAILQTQDALTLCPSSAWNALRCFTTCLTNACKPSLELPAFGLFFQNGDSPGSPGTV